MSKYINICRVKAEDMICGYVNLPYGTECYSSDNGMLYFIKDGEPKILCSATSERGYRWFAYNDDGKGKERKDIINDCIRIMAGMPDKDEKFAEFLCDATAMKYKKYPENCTEWSWDRAAINTAPIEDLEHIRSMLLKMKGLFRNRRKEI